MMLIRRKYYQYQIFKSLGNTLILEMNLPRIIGRLNSNPPSELDIKLQQLSSNISYLTGCLNVKINSNSFVITVKC